jgi:flagellar assembly protein FliH
MSYRPDRAGFAPVPLAEAMGRSSGFRPLSLFASDPAFTADAAEAPAEEPVADDPFARGLAEGQRVAEAAFAVERERLFALLASTDALQDEPSEELAQLIAETVERLVRQIVETAPIDAAWLRAQAEAAAAMVADADKARTLWLHPEDAALLAGAPFALPIAADPSMMRGTVRIEASSGWIEHGRAVHLAELRAALGSEGEAA